MDKIKPHLVVLSGAGISAESGLKTFRDSDGLWEGYNIEDVATPEAFSRNPALVLEFYNFRRKSALEAEPNRAHKLLAQLEHDYRVSIITQNVDNLHEKAGSTSVLHLHGELFKCRSTRFPELIYNMEGLELNLGDKCEKGFQLRPHIVWFGESVPEIPTAINLVQRADVFLIVGTSLQVYPAAGLVDYLPEGKPIYLIDPKELSLSGRKDVIHICEKASSGMEKFVKLVS